MKRSASHAVAVFLGVIAMAASAFASVEPRWSDQQLAGSSRLIVQGRVASVASAWDPVIQTIYTYITLDVTDVLKGSLSQNRIVLKQMGGRVGDIGLTISGQAVFQEGEETLVFLQVRPRDQTLYTNSLWQGKWTIGVDQSGARVASRSANPEAAAAGSGTETRTLASFATQLRALGGQAASNGDALNLAPAEAPVGEIAAGPFNLFSPSARWHLIDDGVAIPVDIQSGGQPGISGNGFAQIATSINIWNAAGSAFRWATGVARSPRCISTFEGDFRTSMSFMDPCDEIDDNPAGAGGTLAFGGAYFDSSIVKTINGTQFRRAVQGFVVNNGDGNTLSLFQSNLRCFQDVQLHELGHVLGLAHSSDTGAMMFPNVDNACQAAATGGGVVFEPISGGLGTDDLNGVRFIYPGGTPPPPGQAPGPPNVTVSPNPVPSGSPFTVTWSPGTGGAPTSYTASVGRSQGASDIFGPQNVGLLTSGQGVLPNGSYSVRIVASNPNGSNFTDRPFTVGVPGPGPCSGPPPAPTNLQITNRTATSVSLAWNAAAGATSYRVQADLDSLVNIFNVDIGNFLAAQGTNLPAGNYAVRIFGVNSCGTSATSANTAFTLP